MSDQSSSFYTFACFQNLPAKLRLRPAASLMFNTQTKMAGTSLFQLGVLVLIPLILFAWYRGQLGTSSPVIFPPIRNTSIETFQQYMGNGSYTSEDLVRTFLARIADVDEEIHAVAEINPNALAIAKDLDRERQISGPRSQLHGIPILVKDTISAHGMNNTAGSYCLVGSKTKNEASVITRLRKAGAIILGKANTSQWGNNRCSSETASNGWSSWGGQTYGVYTRNQDPCGSSSGSAVAMALGLSAVTIGVESVGSITCPAFKSNIVSIKPTSYLVPKDNVIISKLRGSIGPMAMTVRDAALTLNFMAGQSHADPLTKNIPFKKIPDYVSACKLDALRGSRIGIPRNGLRNPIGEDFNMEPVMEIFERTVLLLEKAGATIIDNANYPEWDKVYSDSPQGIYGPAEYAADLAQYFSGLATNPNGIHNISDIISYTKTHATEEYPSRDIAFWEKAVSGPTVHSPEFQTAKEQTLFLGGEGGIDGALQAANADALILPSLICSDIPGLKGYPVIVVPMGYMPEETPVVMNPRGNLVDEAPNVPFGLCFIGSALSEEKLIGLAYAFEQLSQVGSQKAPIILPKTELADIVKKRTL